MMKSSTYHTWALAVTLAQTFRQTVDATYYCGTSYSSAIEDCSIPCPSGLGYNAMNEVNECPEEAPYCFGPDLPCTASENATEAVNVGFLSLGDFGSLIGDNETNATSAPFIAGNETLSPSIAGMSSAPTPAASNDTNATDSMAPSPAVSMESNSTLSPSLEVVNGTSSPTIASNDTNTSSVVPTPAPTQDELDFRKSLDNPSNMFCGTGWQNATDECNTNPNAIPCPMMVDDAGLNTPLECPSGLMCFTIGMSCTPVTEAPTDVPSMTPSSAAPTTYSPTSSPIAADDEVNLYFCGSNLEEANELCGQWCRSGEHTECPQGQKCFKETACNATELNLTIGYDESLLSEVPSMMPTTYKPTEDMNPNDYYCFDAWTDATYDGDCGLPCPGGLNTECPTGQFCYGPIPDCNPVYKVGVSDKWCGSTFEDMADKCAKECPGGTDDECDEGETCWGGSPCALKKSAIADLEALEGKLWCGKNYKDLVENCPMECPGGSDDECDGDMICFDMSTEEMSCNETGVGIREPVDPLHLWCGATWNQVLEECPKACPEGSDEECGPGMICYDLTGNDKICRTPGIGVKEKGDPQKRWCGADYNDMMSSCPRRCPGGSNDECPLGMSCFEGSDCVTEGVGLISAEEKDTSKMFCGSDYTEAMSCGAPCSSGSNDDCPPGQTCWADVECLWGAENAPDVSDLLESLLTQSTMAADVEVEIDEESDSSQALETTKTTSSIASFSDAVQEFDYPSDSEQENEEAPTTEEEPAMFNEVEMNQEANEEFDYPTETESSPDFSQFTEVDMPSEEEEFDYPTTTESSPDFSEFTEVDMPSEEEEFDYPTESQPEPEPEVPQEPEQSPQPEPQPQEEPQPEPQPQPQPQPEPEPSPKTGLRVENIRMALYGISQLSADHVNAWESLTEEYFERFYNEFDNEADATRSGVTDADTIYELTSLSVSSSSRRAGLRLRKLSDSDAYLMEYTQTTRYLSGTGVTLDEVLTYPFSSSRKREAYVQFLKNSNDLFGDLISISAVFLPTQVNAVGSANSFSGNPTSGSSSGDGNPFGEPSSSSSSSGQSSTGAPLDKFSSFYCHNSGAACPSGSCTNNDLCVFVPSGEPVAVGAFDSAPGSDSSFNAGSGSDNAASSIIESFLSGAALDDSPSSGSSPNSSPSSPSSPSNPSPHSSGAASGNINVSTDSASISVSSNSGSTSISIDSSGSSSNQPASEFLAYSNASNGPVTLKGEMTLTGMEMNKVENIYEWQYLTSIYEQEFYNEGGSNGDYVKENINNVATSFEIIEVHYGADSTDPITVIKFKQTIKYDTNDEDIPVSAIVTQPFLTPEYREEYISYLKKMLPDSFGSLSTSSSVPENIPQTNSGPTPTYKDLSETFFCGKAWPVDCATAQKCTSGDMCPYGETCFTAPMCLEQNNAESALVQDESESNMNQFSAPASTIEPASSEEEDEELHPESTYFCGSSREDASRSCGIPCPTRDDESCPGDLQCFGNTHCEDRESFFCGTSWLDASDKCTTPCPNGDASVCADGEACFAWTACLNTESYYCGVSFEDASSNCAHPYASTRCATGGAIACSSGDDSQCPGETKCWETTECSDRTTYFCGTSWLDAAETCSKPCSSGSSDECGENESCYAHTGCQSSNLFYCGHNFEEASSTCGIRCDDRDSNSCPEDQYCFAYVSACADKGSEDISLGAFSDMSGFAGNFKTPDEPWVAAYWAGIEASSATKPASIAIALVSTFALWLL